MSILSGSYSIIESIEIKKTFNTKEFSDFLKQKNFEKIIQIKELFLIAFGKARLSNQNLNEKQSFWVSYDTKQKLLVFSGREHIIQENFKFIEKMRVILLEGLTKKQNSKMILINICDLYLEKPEPIILIGSDEYSKYFYKNYIQPSLSKLAKFCGANYSEKIKKQNVLAYQEVKTYDVNVLKFTWKRSFHFVYSIPPISIPEMEKINDEMYSLFLNQQFCDLSLKSQEQIFKIHSCILYMYGGSVIREMLVEEIKKETPIIVFENYSAATLEIFTTFLYLQGNEFIKYCISNHLSKKINYNELLNFAYTYQITVLINCCTNLLCLTVTATDLKNIKLLKKTYKFNHLKFISRYLINPSKKNKLIQSNLKPKINAKLLEDCFLRNDFKKIIKNKNLFWLAFCKTDFEHQKKIKDKFSVTAIQNIIEEIRIFFLKEIKTRSIIKIWMYGSSLNCFLVKPNFDIKMLDYEKMHCVFVYSKYIQPLLNDFASLFKLDFNQFTQDFKSEYNTHTQKILEYQFTWREKLPLIYPIPPKPIQNALPIHTSLFSLYQRKQFCDFTLKTKNHEFKVHSPILYIYGGPVIKKMLQIKTKEMVENQIYFEHFTYNTIDAFIHFIYLGGKAFSESYLSYLKQSKRSIKHLFQLFAFAHCFQIDPLMDCCTNLISLVATKKNINKIEQFSNLYSNEHLKLLHKKLFFNQKPLTYSYESIITAERQFGILVESITSAKRQFGTLIESGYR
ncbi:MAG: BTB/POZ domain-containing protein [Parachlamydiaceae bacterium]|nr:BTB/POZ domain-containing protein [Parachlamydiaceae bacterium]